MKLTFQNAMLFNPPDHIIHTNSAKLLSDFNKCMLDMARDFSGEAVDDSNLDQYLLLYPLGPSQPAQLGVNRPQNLQIISPREMEENEMNYLPSKSHVNPFTNEVTPMSTSSNSSESSFYFEEETNENEDKEVNDPSGGREKGKKRKFHRMVSEEFSIDKKACQQSTDRQSSLDSYNNQSSSVYEHCIDRSFYPSQSTSRGMDDSTSFSARDFNSSFRSKPFDKPLLNSKAMLLLVSDLSKAVKRLSDDLFVIKFAEYNGEEQIEAAAVQSVDLPVAAVNEGPDEAREHMQDQVDVSSSTALQYVRGKGSMGKASAYLKKAAKGGLSLSESLPGSVVRLIERMVREERSRGNLFMSSDPDRVMVCPFVDTRHTFLEMCQFRHFQFDSLRRAKMSSLMLLFHLFHPDDKKTRPTCHLCKESLRNIRWHCDQCANYDICQSCCDSIGNSKSDKDKTAAHQPNHHPHDLTPFRVSFL